MRILVTGGAGFIGSHIAQAYVGLGHDVWIVDDLSHGKKSNVPDGAHFSRWDIGDKRVANLIAREKIELINHHAAHMDIRSSVENPLLNARVNVLGLLHLLEAARIAGTKRIIFASTGGAIYGRQKQFPAKESHPQEPSSPYAVSKLAGEKYLHFYHQTYGLIAQILRYANVYGPRQNPNGEAGVVGIFISRMLAAQQSVVHGSGKQTRDFVYVQDVVRANVLALKHPAPCLFNVGTAKETDVLTIYRHLSRLTGFRHPARHDAAKPAEEMRSVLDSNAIKKAWGWKAQTPLEKGLEETVQWFRAHG